MMQNLRSYQMRTAFFFNIAARALGSGVACFFRELYFYMVDADFCRKS
jgi:hypothetical protein